LHFLAVRNEPWGATTTRMSWQYLVTNAPVNLRFYFADPRFPALMGIAALVGAMARTRIKQRLVVLAYLLAFWTIYALFYAGSYNYGADVRYSLMTYIPVAVLAGLGIERIATGIRSRAVPAASNRTLLAGVLALLLIQFSWYLPLVRETGEEAWGARADVEYAKEFAAALPKDSFVLTHNPSMFFVWGLNAGQLSIASTEPDYVERVLLPRYAGGVYVHWNFWCNVSDPVQVEFCQKTLAIFPHDLVNQRTLRDYRFALYRLKPR
jgi:branched-subunit amino acid transport protein